MKKRCLRMISCFLVVTVAFVSLPLSAVSAFTSDSLISEEDVLVTDNDRSVIVSDEVTIGDTIDSDEQIETNNTDLKIDDDESYLVDSYGDEVAQDVIDEEPVVKKEEFSEETNEDTEYTAVKVYYSGNNIYESESNDNVSTANIISVNTNVCGSLGKYNDKDYYKFTLNEPGCIAFSFGHEYVETSSVFWKMELYNTNDMNKTLIEQQYAGNVHGEVTNKIGLPRGNYIIYIRQSSYSDTLYHFTVNYTQSEVWEREPNDTSSTATTVNVNSKYDGSIGKYNDKDYYKFTLNEPGCIAFSFGHEYVESSSDFWKMELYNTNDMNKTLTEQQYAGNVHSDVTKKIGLPRGDYIIYIRQSSYSDALYHFTVNYTQSEVWEREPNDTSPTATSVNFNSRYDGSIGKYNDKDYYKFALNEPGCISFSFGHEYVESSSDFWKMELYNTNDMNKTLTEQWYAGNVHGDVSKKIGLPRGNYIIYIRQSSYSDAIYHFTIEPLHLQWNVVDGKSYWYENGVKQGTYSDSQGVIGDGTVRGREIYDPASNAWYWLDSVYDGAKAVGKEVWMPYIYQNEKSWGDAEIRSNANASDAGMQEQTYNAIKQGIGKWVRYDENGRMLKGWVTISGALAELYPKQKGNTYYYDHKTGLMAKGRTVIDGREYYFDEVTGALLK